ncbi:MAG: TIGR02206 family membrane protein [Candidatus Kurthia intestinigallinarum]|uniref:YwaF family protein n=1 Tax=Kurthia sp. Dielmo TaxID=1033738 RepID=UPI00111E5FD6|nr:TIGR02206 family membrane protein [Kurthia sp. Dielmo]
MPTTGFSLYDSFHIGWLAFGILAIWFVAHQYRLATDEARKKIRIALAWALICAEIIRDSYIFFLETWSIRSLPLDLCGMALVVILIYAYTQNKTVGELLYSIFLPGAFAALLFPNWTHREMFSFMNNYSFTYHILIVAFIIMLIASKELRPQPKNLWKSALFLLILTPIMYMFNKHYETNFWFLSTPSAGSPIVPLEHIFGNPGYIFGLVLLLFIVWLVLYLPFALRKKS